MIRAWRWDRRRGAMRGDHDAIADAIITTGVAFRWEPRRGVYLIALPVLDRVLVALEAAGHAVEMEMAPW